MSASAEKANVHFAEVCGGYLESGATGPTSVCQTVRGCSATVVGDGAWLIRPFDRGITTYDEMLISYNLGPKAGEILGAAEIIGPFISTSGLTAPDFIIGSTIDTGDGLEPFDATLCFEVKQIPRNA